MSGRKTLDFYDLDASTLTDSAKKLLREYSGILEDEIRDHAEEIRKDAFKIAPYPCIGMFQFLDMSLMTMDIYQEVLGRVKKGNKFLDLGCCLGQEIRQLVLDGAPSENTFGSDLYSGFFPVGYKLFKDEDRLKTVFIAADAFQGMSPLTKLAGQMNIVYTGAFFHLFSLEDQEKMALRVMKLLAPQPGSLIIGRQSGSEEAGEFSRSGDTSGRTHFRHNAQSWRELWDRVGQVDGSRWSVEADLDAPEFTLIAPTGKSTELQKKMSARGLRYTIRRL
ncbi:hypothetical protein B0T25DRAFT_589067 [Lasiosphaeria hispida]|uniref:Methyltransferase domain-containing protein n=1 Tax=Lasiosphaeria hispida TaxID=260671 RepID=A0AAJ0HKB2_9PEZI|nr:hypothetical protein B0T25DRAFT_589067 [Lasiosphaeria hispida]